MGKPIYKIIVVFLSFLVLASGMQGFIAFSLFKLNQDRLEQAVCINKNKPSKKCHGKCYLKKKLIEQRETQRKAVQLFEQSNFTTLFPPAASSLQLSSLLIAYRLDNFEFQEGKSGLYRFLLEDPPNA